MLTRTVEKDGVTVTLAGETRLTALMRMVYRRHFAALFPDLAGVLLASDAESQKTAHSKLDGNQTDQYNLILDFIITATHIQTAEGLPFAWPRPGEIPALERTWGMFAHFLTDGAQVWDAITEGAIDLLRSYAPPEQAPIPDPASADPNVSAPIAHG